MPANSGSFTRNDPRTNRNGPIGNYGLKFAERVRAATKNGEDLLEFALAVISGKVLDDAVLKDGSVVQVQPPVAVKMQAVKWLAARGLGKEPEIILDENDTGGLGDREIFANLVDALDSGMLAYLQERILVRQKAQGAAQ